MMLVLEPILTLITLYMGFIYGFLYLCFEAYTSCSSALAWMAQFLVRKRILRARC
jgi:hypothetical protein